MGNLMNFSYEQQAVRTVPKDGGVWFIAKDVCDILAITNSRDTLKRLDDDEKGVVLTDTLGGKQEMTAVNEFGLYNLILSSRKPEAKAFKRWVTHEVLPAIRKDGGYVKGKGHVAIEYQGHTIMIESLMNERLAVMEMNREIIKQVKQLAKRVCELEDCSGLFARTNGRPTVHIGSTNADECNSLFVEFVFSGKNKSFNALNTLLQELENVSHHERIPSREKIDLRVRFYFMQEAAVAGYEEQLMCGRREMQNDLILALKGLTLEMIQEYGNEGVNDYEKLHQIRENIALIGNL